MLDNKSCHDKKAANFDLKNKRLILVKRENPHFPHSTPLFRLVIRILTLTQILKNHLNLHSIADTISNNFLYPKFVISPLQINPTPSLLSPLNPYKPKNQAPYTPILRFFDFLLTSPKPHLIKNTTAKNHLVLTFCALF